MAISLTAIQADIANKLNDDFVQPIHNTGIPTAQNLIRVNGKVDPYLVYVFSDLGRGFSTNFAGSRGDDYIQPVNIMAVVPTAALADQFRNRIVDKMLGYRPQYAGQLNKRPGGGTFTVQNEAGGVEAYVAMVAFTCTVQILDV